MLGGAYSLTFLRSETATPAAATAAAPVTPAIAVVSTPVCGEREEVSLEAAVPSDFSPTREMVSAFNEFSFVRQNLGSQSLSNTSREVDLAPDGPRSPSERRRVLKFCRTNENMAHDLTHKVTPPVVSRKLV